MYATYEYYTNVYGGKMPENSFKSNERKAEAYIRRITYVRGNIFNTELDSVKDAVCAVADVLFSTDSSGTKSVTGAVKSENTDGYSVAYVTEQADGQTREEWIMKKAYDAAYVYLLPTGWLSRKVECT